MLATLGVVALVGCAGGWIAGPGSRGAVWLGAGIAAVAQVFLFVLLFVIVFSKRPLLAHGLGMAGRFAVLAAVMVALMLTPDGGPGTTLLLPLIAVQFLTTLLEPFFLSGPERVR
jgi:hypothetical protein